ncbi:Ankyrin repeat [Olea europaea subsp. europaea]|uniref:Ankyrin repeat n=1 Tax=Olea europaea subsp. europaea TaxID=158383 RepID=A0A8S0R489_OLEEU|nr:Ankyrin repeat [Olea europaea subsp. europaea]
MGPEVNLNYYRPLHLAAKEGYWVTAKSIIDNHGAALTEVISLQGMTAVHVAASSSQSEFVEKLADLMPTAALNAQDKRGCTALHYAAVGGTVDAATEILWYLSTLTTDEHPRYAFTGPCSSSLILGIAAADITLDLLHGYSHLATARDETETTILHVLSGHPHSFPSGSRHSFWERFIYSQPRLKHVYGRKLVHKQCFELIEFVCKQAVLLDNEQTLYFFLDGGILHVATVRGVVEIVEATLNYVSDLLWYKYSNHTLLQVAIKHRREKLFNLLIDETARNTFLASGLDNDSNNTLHMAAKLAPSPQLNAVMGPAFQMQRELQWFKEVEKMVNDKYKWQMNSQGKTPRELFTETHKDLLEMSEQWMKDTSNSCMVILLS